MNWQVWMDHLHERGILHGMMFPNLPSGTRMNVRFLKSNGTFVVDPSKYWPELTSKPLAPGSISLGWIWCKLPMTVADFDKENSAVIHVQFDDVISGKTHEATISMVGIDRIRRDPWFSQEKMENLK
jgi:hypothetical protein